MALALAIATILAVILALVPIVIWVYEHRRRPEIENGPLRHRKKVSRVLMWHPGVFYQALAYFDEFCTHIEAGETGEVTRAQLISYAESILLGAASQILPMSQGKANLFRYGPLAQGTATVRSIVPAENLGNAPRSQLVHGRTFRTMEISAIGDANTFPAAGQCIISQNPQVVPVSRTAYRSDIELELGTTHILAIPARHDMAFEQVPEGFPASITVDMRFPISTRKLAIRGGPMRRLILRRSRFIELRMAHLSQFYDTQPDTTNTPSAE